jgi:hypothetical protein
MDARKSLLPVLITGILLATLFATYVAGYFLFGSTNGTVEAPQQIWRFYPTQWLAQA